MKFSVHQSDLLKELKLIQGVIERKTNVLVLSNILLEALEDSLRMTATNLEVGIRTSCSAKVEKSGATTIPAKKLLDYVRQLKQQEIQFELLASDGTPQLRIISGSSQACLPGIVQDNFPTIPGFPGKLAVLPSNILSQMIRRTIFAVSSEESRYTLNGALLLLKPETITMVATDGHRLAYVESDPSLAGQGYSGVSEELRILVPRKAMAQLVRLLGELREDTGIEFGKDDDHLFFQAGGRLLISRVLSGQSPNYEAVLPKGNNKIVVVDHDQITAAIRRVSLFSDECKHEVRFHLNQNELKISAGSEADKLEEPLPVNYIGAPLVIGFNWQYLLDFLAASGSGEISLEFKDEQSAFQMRPVTEEKLKYRYVVMPMRI